MDRLREDTRTGLRREEHSSFTPSRGEGGARNGFWFKKIAEGAEARRMDLSGFEMGFRYRAPEGAVGG